VGPSVGLVADCRTHRLLAGGGSVLNVLKITLLSGLQFLAAILGGVVVRRLGLSVSVRVSRADRRGGIPDGASSRFPQRTTRRPGPITLVVVASLAGLASWAWAKLNVSLDLDLGPGTRVSAHVTIDPVPQPVPPVLPPGQFLHHDVQYFAPDPDFPWANSQAAPRRAGMQAIASEGPEQVVPGTEEEPPR
jgi:hypothetical protein